jgi:hypothetical protein
VVNVVFVHVFVFVMGNVSFDVLNIIRDVKTEHSLKSKFWVWVLRKFHGFGFGF